MKKLLLIALVAIVFYGCKKDEEPIFNKDFLTAKQWQPTAAKDSDGPIVIDNCSKDDLLKFETNGTFTYGPGITKCDQSETVVAGTWSLSIDGKNITINANGETAVHTFLELSATKFVWSEGAGKYAWEETYKAL